jgi:ATP-dependent DNA ligase
MELTDHFCGVVANAHEGLVVKGDLSTYIPGKREQWHKVGKQREFHV